MISAYRHLVILVCLLAVSLNACAPDRSPGQADIHSILYTALQPVSERHARMAENPASVIELFPTPFLKSHRIYRVTASLQTEPVVFYVGVAEGQPAILLTGDPAAYIRLAKLDGLTIASAETAAIYGAAYLEVTRSMSELFYLVASPQEVRFRPNLEGDLAQVPAQFGATYQSIIAPPTAQTSGQGFTVTIYAIREQMLERHLLAITPQGGIQDTITVLERDLPLVYGL